jgi:hypothetical protein
MVTHHVTIGMQQGQALNLATDVIRVTRRGDLAPALKQHAKSVVIENDELDRSFSRLEFWEEREGTYRFAATLIALIVALGLGLQYKLDLNWKADWKLGRFDGKIMFTPTKK